MTYSLRPKQIDFDAVWGELQTSVLNIITLQPISRLTWDHKFSDVYDICVAIPNSMSEQLYNALTKCLEDHVTKLADDMRKVDSSQLLQEYDKTWTVYYSGVRFVHNLFGYLNKQYVVTKRNLDPDVVAQYKQFLQQNDVKEVGCMALDKWKSHLIDPFLSQLVDLLLAAIAEDRAGRPPPNRNVIQRVIESFVQVEQFEFGTNQSSQSSQDTSHKFYQEKFEEPFLAATEEYFSLLAQKLLSDLSCSQYMAAVIEAIDAEKLRSSGYVHKSSVDKVIKMCQNVMISAHREKLNGVCSDLIKHEERKDLQNMYKLLKPIPHGLSIMIKEFENHVKKKGSEAIASHNGDQATAPQQFVENVLRVYDKYNEMKNEVFLDDGDFAGALDKALQAVVNSRIPNSFGRSSEKLARYSDGLLRKSTRVLNESELDEKLSRAIIIFRYIEDKDIFQKYYSKMLSARLIGTLSVSLDAEELMINKLKQACGYEFTCKLSRMFTDINICPEMGEQFTQYLAEKKIDCVQMHPMILTAGSWPLVAPSGGGSGTPATHLESATFILPRELRLCVDSFEDYYTSKHNGRKLNWLYHTSHGELRTSYLAKPYIIHMSVFQMSLLLLFNHRDSYKVSDLSASVGITGELLYKLVRTLIDSNMVTCTDKDISDVSELHLNMSLQSKRIRFKLPPVSSTKQVEKEVEATTHTITQDRKYYIECAVVRIMKTRKVLKHAVLVTEVMDQIKSRFKPDVSLVKKCIEDLIDKSYLQRTDQHDEYQYLA